MSSNRAEQHPGWGVGANGIGVKISAADPNWGQELVTFSPGEKVAEGRGRMRGLFLSHNSCRNPSPTALRSPLSPRERDQFRYFNAYGIRGEGVE